ncbi:MAG: glycosyltransferase family 25 protein [Moraxella sp.]|nr:glycosyltransferase family 25 protein [Moraxella sp.]
MKNQVISLKNAADRRTHITQEFSRQGVSFDFFDAITPELLEKTAQALSINIMDNALLSMGEKACFLSHVCLWQKMIDENLPYMAIFEDDIYLGKNAQLFLQETDWLPKKADEFLIKLEGFDKNRQFNHTPLFIKDGRHLVCLHEEHLGAAGYLLSYKMAEKLLMLVRHEMVLSPVDNLIFGYYPFVKNSYLVYQLNPALCIQSDRCSLFLEHNKNKVFNSQLLDERIQHREKQGFDLNKKKKGLFHKIIREIARPFLRLYKALQQRKNSIGFR